MGYNCLFTNVDVSVFRRSNGSLAFKGVLDGKLYLVDFAKEEAGLDACLIAKTHGLVVASPFSTCGDEEPSQTSKGRTCVRSNKCDFRKR
jgi:hypothetical protein